MAALAPGPELAPAKTTQTGWHVGIVAGRAVHPASRTRRVPIRRHRVAEAAVTARCVLGVTTNAQDADLPGGTVRVVVTAYTATRQHRPVFAVAPPAVTLDTARVAGVVALPTSRGSGRVKSGSHGTRGR